MRRALTAALLLGAILLWSQSPERIQVGPLPGGGILLNSAWIVWPAGRQVPVDSFPMSSALSPDGRHLLVLNAGLSPPSVSVIRVQDAREVSRREVPDAWLGLTFAAGGKLVYVGGGSQAAVYEFSFLEGELTPVRTFPVVDPAKRTDRDFVGDVALSPDGRLLYAAELFRDSVAVINPQSGRVIERFKTGRRPYRILFHPDGQSLFVSSWADGMVLRHSAEVGEVQARLRLGPHPTDMLWVSQRPKTDPDEAPSPYAARIFVAVSNSNNVYMLGVTEANDVRLAAVVNIALTPQQPAGMTPSALAADPEQGRLYVACSDANAVAVVGVDYEKPIVQGMLPAGWYPVSVKALPGGGLAVVNGKGAGQARGTVSLLSPLDLVPLEAHTRIVFENTPYADSLLEDAGIGANGPIPAKPGDAGPIQHVVYVVKGGLTYDEVFGGLKNGNGDPSLAQYPETALPNHHRLAHEFPLLDNFYRNGDGFADGMQWSFAAIASDYVQKLWPASAARRRRADDLLGGEPASYPPAGYLWNNAMQAGISVRNYGCFLQEPSLKPITAPETAGSGGPDQRRARLFLSDFQGFETAGAVPPRLMTICLPGSDPADNDRALGLIVEAVSRSRIWPRTAIFAVEAGGSGGKDHVSPYRSPAFVISPYARRKVTDSTFYNTTSVLRTIELILGLRPMSHFDAAARPLAASFQAKPDAAAYEAAGPNR